MLYQIVPIIFLISTSQAYVPGYFYQLFSFECPNGFLQNGTNCLYYKLSSCPDLIHLNTSYNIIPKKNYDQPIANNEKFCKYSMAKFFEINTINNSVGLHFTLNNVEPVQLYLDVISQYPIHQLENKIHCFADRYGKLIRKVKITEIFKDVDHTTRYLLQIDENISRYGCYFLDAGKMKPEFAVPIVASARAADIPISSVIDEVTCFDKSNLTIFDIYNTTIAEDYDEALDVIMPLLCFDLNVNITSENYCLPITNGSEEILWPLTPAMSSGFCFDKNGEVLTRECILDENGARWGSDVEGCVSLSEVLGNHYDSYDSMEILPDDFLLKELIK